MERTRKIFYLDKSSCFEKDFLIICWVENMFLKSGKDFSISFEAFAVITSFLFLLDAGPFSVLYYNYEFVHFNRITHLFGMNNVTQ